MDLTNIEIDGIKIDTSNKYFRSAMSSIVERGENVFLTGRAGTGKTVFLRTLSKISTKQTIVLAPTGVAAINSKGVTIHSFFQLPRSPMLLSDDIFRNEVPDTDIDKTSIYNSFKYSDNKKHILIELELMIIDEVSMVRCDVIAVVDRLLKVFRNNYSEPFGGVQVVLIGDPFQLPPIVKPDEQTILQTAYKNRFFFSTAAFINGQFEFHELFKIHRQHNRKFIDILNRIREGKLLDDDINSLKKRKFPPSDDKGFIHIATHNAQVNLKNNLELKALDTQEVRLKASVDGTFNYMDYPAEFNLSLKVGAQVMFLRNLKELNVFNGSIGEIVKIESEIVTVKLTENNKSRYVKAEKVTWENREYFYDRKTKNVETNIIGTFTQMPLRLAWAITVHKSQGMTFNKVIADLYDSFTYGQEYVGLSRCVDIESLHLISDIRRNRIGPHPWVSKFYNEYFINKLQ